MKQQFTLSVFAENSNVTLNRLAGIFTRRRIPVISMSFSLCDDEKTSRYVFVITSSAHEAERIKMQIEKITEVHSACTFPGCEAVSREIALYKLPLAKLGAELEPVLRKYNASIVAIDHNCAVVEKTGQENETGALFNELKRFGAEEYARSGRATLSIKNNSNSFLKSQTINN